MRKLMAVLLAIALMAAVMVPVSAAYGTPSGSETKTETKTENIAGETVTVTTTTTTDANSDGSVTKTEVSEAVSESGSTAETTTVTTTNKDGEETVEESVVASVSEESVNKAEADESYVTIPTNVKKETSVTVSIPADKTVKVELPTQDETSDTTVIVIVDADGNETVIKSSVTTDNGIAGIIGGDSVIKVVDNAKDIEDIEGHWAEDSINFVASHEIYGDDSTTFNPEDGTTRGEILDVIARFDSAESEAMGGINFAKLSEISDCSMLDQEITREQLITMLYRYVGCPDVSGESLSFSDASEVSSWAADAMAWAVSVGIIKGVGGNTLNAAGVVTHAQLAAIMERFTKNVVM